MSVVGLLGFVTVLLAFADVAVAQRQLPQKFYRPPQRFAPPVHAQPTRGSYIPSRRISERQAQNPQERYPVRQAAAYQEIDGTINDQFVNDGNQTLQNANDQWRTRSDAAARGTSDFLRSAAERFDNNGPQLAHPSPQQQSSRDWNNQRLSDVAMPDTEVPQMQMRDTSAQLNSEIPGRSNPEFETQPNRAWQTNQQFETPQPVQENLTYSQAFSDRPPAIEDYTTDPFAVTEDSEDAESGSRGHSVLVRDHPLRDETLDTDSKNSLRDLQTQPRRLRSGRGQTQGGSANRSPYRNTASNRRYQQEENEPRMGQDDVLLGDPSDQGRGLKSCEAYRTELLNNPITNIVLDISPRRPKTGTQDVPDGLTRTWTDCNGNPLGTGTLTGLERSFVVITNETGAPQRISKFQLSDGDLGIVSQYWGLPNECSLGCFPFEGRAWTPNSFFWKASALCHKPLYFENRQLERYGHTHGPIVEPVHATVHFFTSLVMWPYNTGIHPPNECLYALGFYRPGDCAPWLKEPMPLSLHGAVNQGIAIGAIGAIIP